MDKDISHIFKSYDIRGKVGTELNKNSVEQIARAYANWLPKKGTIAVGRDMRPDSKELAKSFIKGLVAQGYDVWDIGEVTSDMVYFAIGKWDLAGGAVITASHNPGDDNGIKLYRDKVIAVGLDSGLSEIRDEFLNGISETKTTHNGNVTKKDITNEWVDHCLSFIENIGPFHVAVDAGNGMAGAILPHILDKLPIKVERMYFDLDGSFPNHEANPQKYENLKDLINKVITDKLDFGIAFDGDGDRAVFVDNLGRPVLGTDVISMVAKLYLDKLPGAKIVHDVRTSRATSELIKSWGGEPVRTKAGRVNIGSLMRKIGAPFGGETTGHLFFKENYDADSGLIAALMIMQALSNSGEKLSDLVDKYRLNYVMIPEMNLKVKKQPEKIFDELKTYYSDGEFDFIDGLTVSYSDKWFNLRASNTEPIMRLNAESTSKHELDKFVENITSIVNK